MSDYLDHRRRVKLGIEKPAGGPKPKQPIKPISDKKKAQQAAEKKILAGEDTQKEKWFKARRIEMVGVCQCGCARPSSKGEDLHFRSSAAHIFPKAIFFSIQYHKLNWVERNFWDGCHTNMDNQGMSKWPNMADWDDIKEKFHVLAPLLTDEERRSKFYTNLEKIIYAN